MATRSIWNKRGGPLMFKTAVAVTKCMMGALRCSWCRWSENHPELERLTSLRGNIAPEGSKHTLVPTGPHQSGTVRSFGPAHLFRIMLTP